MTGTVREGQGRSGLCGVHVGNLRLKSAGGSMDKSTYRAAGPFPKRNTDWLLFFSMQSTVSGHRLMLPKTLIYEELSILSTTEKKTET